RQRRPRRQATVADGLAQPLGQALGQRPARTRPQVADDEAQPTIGLTTGGAIGLRHGTSIDVTSPSCAPPTAPPSSSTPSPWPPPSASSGWSTAPRRQPSSGRA